MEHYSNIAGDTLYISLSLFLSLSFPLSLPSLSPFHRDTRQVKYDYYDYTILSGQEFPSYFPTVSLRI